MRLAGDEDHRASDETCGADDWGMIITALRPGERDVGEWCLSRSTPIAAPWFWGVAWPTVQLPLALLIASSSAAAQPADTNCPAAPTARVIQVGGCIRSSIGPDDPKIQDNTSYEDWRLDLEAGETVQIDMDAIPTLRPSVAGQPPARHEFDTYLELRRDGMAEPLATNDDREDSLNSRIRFTAPATDHYVVRARPVYLDGGDYRLSVSRPRPPPAEIAIVAGRTRVEPGQAAGNLARLYSFGGTRGEVVRFSLDPRPLNFTMQLLGRDDVVLRAAGGLMSARTLVAILPYSGPYRLQLGSERAATALIFERRIPEAAPAPQRVEIGETVEGDIGFESQVGRDPYGSTGRSFYKLYELNLQAGELVTVTLESSDFDPVLDAGVMSPLGYASARTNDDFEEASWNARLVVRPDRAGPVFLRVRAIGSGLGAFRLTVTGGIEYPDEGRQE
jgi:hypothetical protein